MMTDRIKNIFPVEIRNILWISVAGWLEAVQALLFVIWASGFVPFKNVLLFDVVMPENLSIIRPEREMLFYRVFVLAAIVLQAAGIWIFRRKLGSEKVGRSLRPFVAVEFLLVFALLSAGFKIIVYPDRPWLAQHAYHAFLVLAVLNKIFWFKIKAFGKRLYDFLMNEKNTAAFRAMADWMFPLLIVAVIYIPDSDAVVARMFVGEQFHHTDSFAMGPGWAYLKGCVLNMDLMSQYGLGIPILISRMAQWLGGFSYERVFTVTMGMGIVYFLLCYIFLRQWLGAVILAGIGVLYGIKLQMFHQGAFPIVWTYPSATVVRYWFDVLFFYTVLAHLRTGRRWLLWIAGALCGLQVFYLPPEGIYLSATFYFYLLFLTVMPAYRPLVLTSRRGALRLAGEAVVPLAAAFILFWGSQGRALFTPEYWANSREFIEYFLSGFGTVPMSQSLRDRNFLALLAGLAMPIVYVMTILAVGSRCYLRRHERDDALAVVVSVYGLGLFHYYVARSSLTSYDTVSLPYVFVLCFWIREGLRRLTAVKARQALMVLTGLVIYALATNQMAISYPNVFCWSRNPMTDRTVAQPLPDGRSYFNHLFSQMPEAAKLPLNSLGSSDEDLRTEVDFESDEAFKAYYRQESDFQDDAALIARLTANDAKVPVISSFETKILMQADRRPFFYYFPLVLSRPMHMRTLVVTSLYSTGQLEKTIRQLREADPPYIFMERIFYNGAFLNPPPADIDPFRSLMYFVHHYYTPYAVGKFLVAMKRNGVPFEP